MKRKRSLRLLGLALVVVCAFGITSVASASAAGHWYHNGTRYVNGVTDTVTGTQTSSFALGAKLGGVKVEITCTGESTSGTLENTAAAGLFRSGTIHFTGCTVTKPSGQGCTANSPGESTGHITVTNLSATATSATSVEFTPPAGSPFVEIHIGGCPALENTYPVEGQATATASGNVLSFTSTSGSALTLGGATATFTGSSAQKNSASENVEVGA